MVKFCSLIVLFIELYFVLMTFEFEVLFFGAILLFIFFIFTNLFLLYNDCDKLSVEEFCVDSTG